MTGKRLIDRPLSGPVSGLLGGVEIVCAGEPSCDSPLSNPQQAMPLLPGTATLSAWGGNALIKAI